MALSLVTYAAELQRIEHQYEQDHHLCKFEDNLQELASRYHGHFAVADHLIATGSSHMESGDYPAGIAFFKAVHAHFPLSQIANKTSFFLRMAEYYIENQQTDLGIACLIDLCTNTVTNYEESIEWNGLTEVWLKYKHLVEGKVPDSVGFHTAPSPLPPDKCSMSIGEIFLLPEEDILSALSEHLGEMSAAGAALNYLNQWERTVFYIDELCTEVNSGGFGHYLYYYGDHFGKVYMACEKILATEMTKLLACIQTKFPRKKLPASIERLQDLLDNMEEKGIDFEEEDTKYYSAVEKQLISHTLEYIKKNQKHFR